MTLEDTITDIGGQFWILVLVVVIGLGLWFTIATRAVQFRLFPQMLRTLGDRTPAGPDGRAQSISAFQAFCVSAASRVGVGNIAGVGTAIATGGPGAVFWMWTMAALGAASAFIESTLAQAYKVVDHDEHGRRIGFRGGPAYYMQLGLRSRWMGVVFAVVLVLCFPLAFSSLQANTIVDTVTTTTGTSGVTVSLVLGLALAALTGAVVFGGLRRIASVADKVVPLMAGLYLVVGLVIVLINLPNVPSMVAHIVTDAFTPNAVTGGAIGTVILIGVQRGMFSNEAGLGSAPNAGATAAVTHPVKQGLVQSLGVYFDTMIVCSVTAFIILSSNPTPGRGGKGIDLTQSAMVTALGPWVSVLLTAIIFLLAFSSILGNYYYGESNLEFLAGENRVVLLAFRAVAVLAVLAGSLAAADLVWAIADQIMGIMALVNLVAIALLSRPALRLLAHYTAERRAGRDPVFTVADVDLPGRVEFWQDTDDVTGGVSSPR